MTADEIRARWAGIDLDSLWDWDHKDLRKQVEHGVADIDYLLQENEWLTWFMHLDGSRRCRHCKQLEAAGHSPNCIIRNAIPTQSERNSDAIAAEKE